MGLLKKKDKKTSSKMSARMAGGAGGSQISSLRPRYVESLPPCTGNCPSGNDIRGWLTIISLREKLGLSLDEACEQAWRIEMETNPFPSVMGRVCPHPCETGLDFVIDCDITGGNNTRSFLVQDQFGLITRVHGDRNLFKVKQDFNYIFLNTFNAAVLMKYAFYIHIGYRATRHAGKQHTAQSVAKCMAKTAFKRLDNYTCLIVGMRLDPNCTGLQKIIRV